MFAGVVDFYERTEGCRTFGVSVPGASNTRPEGQVSLGPTVVAIARWLSKRAELKSLMRCILWDVKYFKCLGGWGNFC